MNRDKIKEMANDRIESHQKLMALNSRVYKAFLEVSRKAFSPGSVPKKYKELIAVGIAVMKGCESCLEWHVKQAIDSGCSRDEIVEAIEVGIAMGGGPALGAVRFALKVMDYYGENKL